jgi:RNA polymerase sigma-70 factor, ECF subfamily
MTARQAVTTSGQTGAPESKEPEIQPGDAGELLADRELLVRVQDGDAGAFDALVQRYLPRARQLARRIMSDPDDADDLVQDAFLRALDRIATFDVGRAFGPWFNRLLVNTGIDLKRKQTVRRTESQDPETFAGKSSPHTDAERSELRQSLAEAMEKLPDRQRLIISLFEVDGHSTEEVADMLKVSQVTVRWHLHQARRTLRESLKGWME